MRGRFGVTLDLLALAAFAGIAIFSGFKLLGRSPQSHWLVLVLGVLTPVAVGKIADRIYLRSA